MQRDAIQTVYITYSELKKR